MRSVAGQPIPDTRVRLAGVLPRSGDSAGRGDQPIREVRPAPETECLTRSTWPPVSRGCHCLDMLLTVHQAARLDESLDLQSGATRFPGIPRLVGECRKNPPRKGHPPEMPLGTTLAREFLKE